MLAFVFAGHIHIRVPAFHSPPWPISFLRIRSRASSPFLCPFAFPHTFPPCSLFVFPRLIRFSPLHSASPSASFAFGRAHLLHHHPLIVQYAYLASVPLSLYLYLYSVRDSDGFPSAFGRSHRAEAHDRWAGIDSWIGASPLLFCSGSSLECERAAWAQPWFDAWLSLLRASRATRRLALKHGF